MNTSKSTKVLIVDDSLVLRERLVEMLSAIDGLTVVGQARNAGEAIASVESFCPDLVILDIQMPGPSGLEVLRHIKKNHPRTVVAILTNHAAPQYRKRCMEMQADYFLSKSTDAKQLREICGRFAVPHEG